MKKRVQKLIHLAVMMGMIAPTQALTIDTMLLISGQNPKGDYLTLRNNSEVPVFVKTEVSTLKARNNQVTETPFNRDNLLEWGITLDPSLFILDPGESRQVALNVLTAPTRTRDEVYGVAFIPQATLPDQSKGDQMNIQVGFKAYYIVPAKDGKMDYGLRYEHATGQLTLTNRGDTLLLAKLDRCQSRQAEDPNKPCSVNFLAIAGKEKVYTVPEWLRGETMAFEMQNHDKGYRQQVVLTPQQPAQQGGNRK